MKKLSALENLIIKIKTRMHLMWYGSLPEKKSPQLELFDGLHYWQICEDCGQEYWCLKGSYSAITRQCSKCYERKIYEQFEKKLFSENSGEEKK